MSVASAELFKHARESLVGWLVGWLFFVVVVCLFVCFNVAEQKTERKIRNFISGKRKRKREKRKKTVSDQCFPSPVIFETIRRRNEKEKARRQCMSIAFF